MNLKEDVLLNGWRRPFWTPHRLAVFGLLHAQTALVTMQMPRMRKHPFTAKFYGESYAGLPGKHWALLVDVGLLNIASATGYIV